MADSQADAELQMAACGTDLRDQRRIATSESFREYSAGVLEWKGWKHSTCMP
jgi:hypothetical protein